MEFRLLGPLEVVEGGRFVSLGGSRARSLLALLLLHRNEVVAVDRIVDELWGEQPPRTAGQAVRVYVSQLRKSLEAGSSNGSPQVLLTRDNGYLLRVDPGEVDLDRFDALRTEGRRRLAAGDVALAADVLGEALSLWRGPPLHDFAYEPFARSEIARLEELRLATLEDRFDAQLAAGRDSELVADLQQLVESNPLRERLRAQLMLALYRSGRQAEALEKYQGGRRHMVDELGLEPSETLRRLEARILQRDPELDPPTPLPYAETPEEATARSRRLGLLAVAAVLVGIAAVAGLLVAATAGHGRTSGAAASLRVALVEPSTSDPLSTGPIDAVHAAARQLGFRPKVIVGGEAPDTFLQKVAVAARKYELVVVGPTPDLQSLSELTREFPRTRFLVPDSVHDPSASFAGQPNVTGVDFHDYENGYLGGYLAALMTHGREAVSAVGGRRMQSVNDLVRGFEAGARKARPRIRVLVVYTGSFTDQNECRAAANRQIGERSRVVFDVAGYCGIGALNAVANHNGVWGLGVDANLSLITDRILGSVVKRVGLATRYAVTLFAHGRLPGGRDLTFDFANHGIGLVGINGQVPRAVQRRVARMRAVLIARDRTRDAPRRVG